MKYLLLIISLSITPFLGISQFHFTDLAPMPEKISNNSVCGAEINGLSYMYSFGGIDSSKIYSGIHNRCFKYDIQSNSWTRLPDLPQSNTRIASGASVVKNHAYIIGGYHVLSNGNEQSSNLVHRLDLQADTFLTNGAPLPRSTDDHVQSVYKDSLIFVITGWSQTANIPDVQIYNPALDTWLIGTSVPNTHYYKSFGASGSIIGDTLYYFGGASMGANFPIQNLIRKGYINPTNVTDITWSIDTISSNLVGYRMASATFNNQLMWIGGSDMTYNYNGIAYQGGTPVEPNHRILLLDPISGVWSEQFDTSINMDFRGVAQLGCSYYLAGGMQTNQTVSDHCVKISCIPNSVSQINMESLKIYPNPTSSMVHVLTQNGITQVTVFDHLGRSILSLSPKTQTMKIDMSPYMNGLYFFKIQTSQGSYLKKVILVK